MFKTLQCFDTKLSADSVEWCPIQNNQSLFVCGTYELMNKEDESSSRTNEPNQKRQGKIYLFEVSLASVNSNEPQCLILHEELKVPAVLDMKWAHVKCDGLILLGVVNSLGYLQVYKLIEDHENEMKKRLTLITEQRVTDSEDEVLALSLDWNTGRSGQCQVDRVRVSVSDSKGSISVFELNQLNLEMICSKKQHDFEAWITCFDYWDPNVVYSGGDDAKFKRFDLRVDMQSSCNKIHEAGVTSFHSNSNKEFLLASGSYDEKLRLWDSRNFSRPICEKTVGGGIWRLKWDPFEFDCLLAACMYDGFKIIQMGNANVLEIVGEYKEHESIAYGSDWSLLSNFNDQSDIIIATCSFYDHKLDLISVNLNKTIKNDSK